MKTPSLACRMIALVLLLSLLVGLIPVSAVAVEGDRTAETRSGKDYSAEIAALPTPVRTHNQWFDLSSVTDISTLSGYYFMVNRDETTGTAYAIDPVFTNGRLAAYAVDASGEILYGMGSKLDAVVELRYYIGENPDGNWYNLISTDNRFFSPKVDKDGNVTMGTRGYTNVHGLIIVGQNLYVYKSLNYSENDQIVTSFGLHSLYWTGTDFYMASDKEVPKTDPRAWFRLYRMESAVQELYDAIQAAKTYATGNGAYFDPIYGDFTSHLEACMELYAQYNHYFTDAELTQLDSIKKQIEEASQKLRAYFGVLTQDHTAMVDGMSQVIPINEKFDLSDFHFTLNAPAITYGELFDHAAIAMPDGTNTYQNWGGTYLLVNYNSSDQVYRVLDPTADVPAVGKLASKVITLSEDGESVFGASEKMFFTATERPGSTGNPSAYWFSTSGGSYLRAVWSDDMAQMSLGPKADPFGLVYGAGKAYMRIYRYLVDATDQNRRYDLQCKDGQFGWVLVNDSSSVTCSHLFFKAVRGTGALYNAIYKLRYEAACARVDGSNMELAACLEESIALYKKYNHYYTDEEIRRRDEIQAELDAQTAKLLTYSRNGRTNLFDGTYYLVAQLDNGAYYALDPYTPASTGKWNAAPVTVQGDSVVGADPLMALRVKQSNTTNPEDYTVQLWNDYFMSANSNQYLIQSSQVNIAMSVRSGARIRLLRVIDGTNHWITYAKRTHVNEELEYFEWSANQLGYVYKTNTFFMYRLMEDRLNTENLRNMIRKVREFIAANVLYDADHHQLLLDALVEAVRLYTKYNGVTLTQQELVQKEALQKQLDEAQEELWLQSCILSINRGTGTNGKASQVHYFPSNLYNWNEDEVNQKTRALDNDEDSKGFYFEAAKNKPESGAYYSYYDSSVDKETAITNAAQNYSVTSGIAAADLSKAYNVPFANDVVAYSEFWTDNSVEGVKDVYTDVQIPFVFDPETGYYTMSSDENAVFFADDHRSGIKLNIADRPASFGYSSVGADRQNPSYVSGDISTHLPTDSYITGFQPFADMSDRPWEAYTAVTAVGQTAERTPSYLLNGVGSITNSKTYQMDDKPGQIGRPVYGFGMKLDIEFMMTEDGLIDRDTNQPITFEFSGDDDVWVYIDGKLVMDIGGSHDAIQGKINFSNGEVIVRSDKFGQIRDKNPNGYAKESTDRQWYLDRGLTVTAMGTIPENTLYQRKNMYTESLDCQDVEEFAQQKATHTLTVYYMDRGKGKTNSAITFNLPQADTLTVEKEIQPYYGKADGSLTSTAISAETMAHLNTLDFGFTLFRDQITIPYEPYYVYNTENILVDTGATDSRGHFTLKNGQRAEFRSLQFYGEDYQVVEDALSSRWAESRWEGNANGTALAPVCGSSSPVATVHGIQYETEVISYTCTNTYIYTPTLKPEPLTVVMDYGKPIEIPIVDDAVVDGVSELLIRKSRVERVEIQDPGRDYGDVLVYDSKDDGQDRMDTLRFTLKKLLDRPVHLRCTLGFVLDDATPCEVVIPVTILPATLMYYETDFVLNQDGSSPIFCLSAASEEPLTDANKWHIVGTATKDIQDYGEVGDTVYVPEIDKESIPMNAFFVDFDGRGYEQRYSVDPLYNGIDFDESQTWVIAEGLTDLPVVDTKSGTLSLNLPANETKLYHYIQTATPGGNYHSDPLNYAPGEDHFLQVRFKVENCRATDAQAYFKVYFTQGNQANDDVGKADGAYLQYPVDMEKLRDGEYITIRTSISELESFRRADVINAFRFELSTVCPKDLSKPARIVYDYIYVGPEVGMKGNEFSRNSLFFGFENTQADRERYDSPIYGANNNSDYTDDRNFDNGAWSYGTGWVQGLSYDNDAGTMTMEVTQNNGGDAFVDTFFNVGYTATGDRQITQPTLSYHPNVDDIAEIRLRLDGFTANPDTKVFLNYFTLADTGGGFVEANASSSVNISTVGEYVTLRLPLHVSFLTEREIHGVRIFFDDLVGTGTATFDYLYMGPEDGLSYVNRRDEYLYFTFNNTQADRGRYGSDIYGGIQFDESAPVNWSYNVSRTASVSMNETSGTLSMVSKNTGFEYVHTGATASLTTAPLYFSPAKAEIAMIRFKVKDMQCTTLSNGQKANPLLVLWYSEGEVAPSGMPEAGRTDKVDAAAIDNGEYVTAVIELSESFRKLERVSSIRPSFSNLTGLNGQIIIDYIYVGPRQEAKPAARSLFFGFDDLQADRDRYDSDTYGSLNYDAAEKPNWFYYAEKSEGVEVDSKAGVLVASSIGTLPAGEYPDLYIDTGIGSAYSGTPLDFHPQDAEVFQVRFKMTGFTRGSTMEEPYVLLQYTNNGAGEPLGNVCGNACYAVPFDPYYLNGDSYLTVTCDATEEFRNQSAIHKLRPFFGQIKSLDPHEPGKITIDYLYVGPGDQAPTVYGYDSTYEDDPTLSDNSSYCVEGLGVKVPDAAANTDYTEASFDFVGTGFDIISRTGVDQATIRVEVRRKNAPATEQPVKTLTVNNKGELELYQIPVVSVQGLEHGEYTVTLWVNKAVSSPYPFLQRGGEFHFDAVRIYDPINTELSDNASVLQAYQADKEAYPSIKEVRNILLSATEFAALLEENKAGAVFVDSAEVTDTTIEDPNTGKDVHVFQTGIQLSDHYALDVQTYNKIGPKNEIYLDPGQAVAFKLQISTSYVPTSLDVGVKTIAENMPGQFVVGVVSEGEGSTELLELSSRRELTISSATSQYYALELDSEKFKEEKVGDQTFRYCYIVLYNAPREGIANSRSHVLSVTDLKIAYSAQPEVGLPKDQNRDPEILPTETTAAEDTQAAATASDAPEKKNSEAATEYYKLLVDGNTAEAAALVIRSVLETPIMDEDTVLMHSLNLAADISLNYVVSKAALEGREDVYLQCRIPTYEGNTLTGSRIVTLQPVEKGNYDYFTLDGLTAVQMGDVIEGTLHYSKDGREYYTPMDSYSIGSYAYSQLAKDGAPEKLKLLCANLLRYGAAAQSFKGYRTDALVDQAMTEEQRGYLTDLDAVTFGNHNRDLGNLKTPTVLWVGKSLLLDSKVTLRYVFHAANYSGSVEELSLRVTYKDYKGETKTATVTGAQPYGTVAGRYSFDFDGLLAAELRSVLHAAVYAGETQVSNTLEYSVDTYGNNKEGALGTLCKALMAYSDAALAYFA